ncbi:unnamed protein product [Paramecium primaurelia]|uniref:Uncharacterized protein n=1 Tax=Paramecium primaurelia TaxID=5886 RepID=A0A8S1NL55_PARPR|nr:unnamed protein product [Paramecium primaurelia]
MWKIYYILIKYRNIKSIKLKGLNFIGNIQLKKNLGLVLSQLAQVKQSQQTVLRYRHPIFSLKLERMIEPYQYIQKIVFQNLNFKIQP